MSNSCQTWLLFVVIFLVSLASFQFNALHVASNNFYENHQKDTEQYVLDGILHAELTDETPILGRYTRPSLGSEQEHYDKAQMLFNLHDHSGEFAPYRSQFGLQVYIYYFLHKTLNASIFTMQLITSMLMAITVSLFFLALRKEFSLSGSLLFCLSLVTSQWVVVFARNIYWIEATWFLPALVSLYFGKAALSSHKHRRLLLTVLFTCFLIKFLCGYEYITTIFLSSYAPLAYYCLKYAENKARMIPLFVSVAAVAFCALLSAFSAHSLKVSGNLSYGFHHIVEIAEKNTSSKRPVEIARAACADKFMSIVNNDQCVKEYLDSLGARRLAITNDYFIFWHFMPWLDNYEVPLDKNLRDSLRRAIELKRPFLIIDMFSKYTFGEKIYALIMVSPLICFTAFILAVFFKTFKRSTPWHWRALILLSFSGTLSWFLLAKGHCYFHKHLNYVLWYVCFIPFATLFLASAREKTAD